MTANRRVNRTRIAMWSAIGGSLVLLGVLLLAGLGQRAWTIAAAVLLLSCVPVCAVSIWQGAVADREVKRAVERLVALRAADHRVPGDDSTPEPRLPTGPDDINPATNRPSPNADHRQPSAPPPHQPRRRTPRPPPAEASPRRRRAWRP